MKVDCIKFRHLQYQAMALKIRIRSGVIRLPGPRLLFVNRIEQNRVVTESWYAIKSCMLRKGD